MADETRVPRRHPWRARMRAFREGRRQVRAAIGRGIRFVFSPLSHLREELREWVEPRRKVVLPVAAVIGIGLAAILPFLRDWFAIPLWLQRATSGSALTQVGLFVLFALGLNVVVGFAGLLDLGY